LRQIGREDLIEQMLKESEMIEIEPATGKEKEADTDNVEAIDEVA
jgi:hypothetical protein